MPAYSEQDLKYAAEFREQIVELKSPALVLRTEQLEQMLELEGQQVCALEPLCQYLHQFLHILYIVVTDMQPHLNPYAGIQQHPDIGQYALKGT